MMYGEVLRSDVLLLDMHEFSVFTEDVTGENSQLNRGKRTALLSNVTYIVSPASYLN